MSLRLFRIVGLIEGLTTLALFFIAMPLKYVFGDPRLVPPVGMAHGVAFLVYLATMCVVLPRHRFTRAEWLRTTGAAFIPVGTFLNDGLLRRKQEVAARAQEDQAGDGLLEA